jgi:hypothetical protein
MPQPDESPKHSLWRSRADWLLVAVALAGYLLAWIARNGMTGDIRVRAQLVGLGKAVGHICVILFVVQVVRAWRDR